MKSENAKLSIKFVIAWIVLSSLYIYFLYTVRLAEYQDKLEIETAALNRILSQRVDQHAAHLTSLSVLGLAGVDDKDDLFLQVANAIRTFYPRITAIDLVPLKTNQFTLSTRTNDEQHDRLRQLIQNEANASKGQLMLALSPVADGRYLLIKRSPNSEMARYALSLEIDIDRLIETDNDYWGQLNTSLSLALPNPKALIEQKLPGDTSTVSLYVINALSSHTQPLILETSVILDTLFFLHEQYFLTGLLLIAFVLILTALIYKLLHRTRVAEKKARLGENEARVAHASRVNSLGEIASGMAHELNQPLTAIISQSQAGLHLIAREEPALIEKILQDNVTQAKRADQILSRLRNWTRRGGVVQEKVSLKNTINNVIALLENESSKSMIDVSLSFDSSNPEVLGNPVEVEQVIFNLMKNAIESLQDVHDRGRKIELKTTVQGEYIDVEVNDNGPGITGEIKSRLFEPFASSKAEGMGLGLIICERIVERMNGNLTIINIEPNGVSAIVKLPGYQGAI